MRLQSPKAACNYGGTGQRPPQPNQRFPAWAAVQRQRCGGEGAIWGLLSLP